MTTVKANSTSPRTGWTGQWGIALATLAVFLLADHGLPDLVSLAFDLGGYAHSLVVKLAQTGIVFLALGLVLRMGPRRAAAELGLLAPLGRAWLIAFIATLPMLLAFAATGRLAETISLPFLAATGLLVPVAEEILFRGYAFGQLYYRARWGFWPAILIPTIFFSLGHLYQAESVLSAIGIFAVTAAGSVWFAWLFMRWENLWIPIALHGLMNFWWAVFDIDDSALGGWVANGARLLTVVLAIVLTIYRDRIWKSPGIAGARENVVA